MLTRTFATFRLGGDSLDPDRVNGALGLQPTEAFRKGEPIGRRGSTRQTAGWMLDTRGSVQTVDLEAHIAWLLDRVEPVADRVATIRQDPGIDADVFCFLEFDGQGGLWLDPELMRRLAALDLSLGVDLYYLNAEEDPGRSIRS